MRPEAFILNLCSEVSQELVDYFESRNLKLIDPRVDDKSYKWTHILTQDINDFGFIRETYQTIEEDIQVISVTSISDKQNFVLANGKLCIEEEWFKSDLKDFLLDKFFQSFLEPEVITKNSVFKELGYFSINQFFSFGDQLDHMSKAAFGCDISGLAVKTYIDHLLMYIAALKNSSKMELPVEITYGESDHAFGVQVYFSAQDIMLDDVSACLSLINSRRAEETLLSTALNCCDFFDLSLVSKAQKLSITALWLKNHELENPSFMLSLLPHKAQLVSYITDEDAITVSEFSDPTEKIQLPSLEEGESKVLRQISKESFSEVIATRIAEKVELEKVKRIVGHEISDDDIFNLLEQSADEEEKIVVGSSEELENVLEKVSSAFEELNVYKKDFFNEEELLTEVLDSLKENHADVMEVKSIESNLPENLKKSLSGFCQEKMLVSGNLNREHIKEFQVYFLKNNLRSKAVVLNPKGRELIKDLKSKLERRLKADFQESDVKQVIQSASENEADEQRVKSIFKDTLKESLEENFKFSRKGVISQEEEKIIVESLSSSLEEDKQVLKEIITNEEGVKPHIPLFKNNESEKEKALLVQLESLKQEKKSLAQKLQATLMEVRVLKEAKTSVASIQSKASEASNKETQQDHFDENIILKKEIQQKLAEGYLNSSDQKKLSELMEKELALMTAVREQMLKFKKLQIESSQKEAMYSSEIEKLNRQLKAREIILEKSKENLVKVSKKKEAEVEHLKNKLDQAQVNLQIENSNNYASQNKHLKVQNLNLQKQVDVYKSKLSSLSLNLKKKDEATSFKDDLRKVHMEKTLLQNELSKLLKEQERSKSLLQKEMRNTKDLRNEVRTLKEEINKLESLARVEPQVQAKKEDLPAQAAEVDHVQLEKIKTLEAQVVDLEMRLAEAVNAQRVSSVDEKKMLHVEANLKKITQDLIEARNQTNDFKKENNKLRQEKTALQNQLERMRKEAQKARKAG
ncbi:MAG TPA: hypothetical protein VKZ84_06130 [Bacteriovoracaceae bacterium]|nr:hypothetical protein [Bacteriovoracaceae bacterium]